MKKLSLLCFLLLNSYLLFAQNSTVKTRVVNGYLMSSAKDVIQNADSSKELSTFISAIKAAGLTDTFKSTGPITVFAPANAAFAKLPAGTLDTLLTPVHLQDLKKLILGHVITGSLTSKEIAKQIRLDNGQAILTTLSGAKLTATIDINRNIVLTDENGSKSIIAAFDIVQSNGILDIVTAVLIPKKNQP
jgi:uncharacterized surface protein with fasciclin (FAS1) repeats